jgi:hypothetical protein
MAAAGKDEDEEELERFDPEAFARATYGKDPGFWQTRDTGQKDEHGRPITEKYINPYGAPSWAQKAAQQARGVKYKEDWYKTQARRQQRAARQRQGQALGLLQERAEGRQSAVQYQALAQREAAQKAIAAQAAAGGYSPAAQRAALYASGGMQSQMAAQVAAARAAEMQQAQQAYLQGAGQMRAGDFSAWGLGLRGEAQMNQQVMMAEQLAQQYQALGLQDKAEQIRANISLLTGRQAGYQAMQQRFQAGVMGGVGALAAGLTGGAAGAGAAAAGGGGAAAGGGSLAGGAGGGTALGGGGIAGAGSGGGWSV